MKTREELCKLDLISVFIDLGEKILFERRLRIFPLAPLNHLFPTLDKRHPNILRHLRIHLNLDPLLPVLSLSGPSFLPQSNKFNPFKLLEYSHQRITELELPKVSTEAYALPSSPSQDSTTSE